MIDGKHKVDYSKCNGCSKCVEVCPTEALKIAGEKILISDLMKELVKDKHFYKSSKGGVTISGGEPLSQIGFLLELLKELKKEDIHTCVDTCGYAPTESFKKILPYTDAFLFDYKIGDSDLHKKLTGLENELILNNLDFLYENGANIYLRCPIIPSLNDNDKHFNEIAQLAKKYPNLENVEIMPYHNTGNHKYSRYGKDNPLINISTVTEDKHAEWIQRIKLK